MSGKNESDLEYYLGQAVALEALPLEMQRKAGEMFAARQDERAKWYRELEDDFRRKATAARAHYRSLGGTK